MNHWQPELGEGPRGAFYFDPGVTALNPEALDGRRGVPRRHAFVRERLECASPAFLLGAPDVSGKSSQFIKMNSFENQYALYVRDRWRALPKLTIDLGLRWELYPNRTRSGGLGIESYDPTTNEALIGGRGGIPQDNGVGYSKKLFAPRIGFAYQMTPSTVDPQRIRHLVPFASVGRAGVARLVSADGRRRVLGRQRLPAGHDVAGYVSAGVPNAPLGPNVGIPSICCPDISPGRMPLPLVAETGYPVANQQLDRGYIQSWNLIVERKLPWELVGSIGYVGTNSVRGFAFLDINASQVPGSGDDGRPLFAQFGRTTTTREWNGRTHSTYHSLQTTVNRRFADGLLLRAAYTYSKAIDQATYSDWTEFRWNAASVFDRNRAQATTTSRTTSTWASCTSCRSAAGKTWATSGASSAILGGWQLNGLFSAYQGRPYTLTASGASLNMPGNPQTPDQIKDDGRTVRERRGRWHVFRHDRVRAGDRRPVRRRRPQHDARAGCHQPGRGPLPDASSLAGTPAAVPARGVQLHQHAAFRQPERQRQQLELREDPRDAEQRDRRPVSRVPLRRASDLLAPEITCVENSQLPIPQLPKRHRRGKRSLGVGSWRLGVDELK